MIESWSMIGLKIPPIDPLRLLLFEYLTYKPVDEDPGTFASSGTAPEIHRLRFDRQDRLPSSTTRA